MKTRFLLTSAGALIVLILATLVVIGRTRPDREPEVEQIETTQIEAAAPETQEETTQEETHKEETVFISSNRIISLDDLDPDWEKAEEDLSAYSVQELADYVLNAGLDGPDREAYLGDRYDEVQSWIDANYVPPISQETGEISQEFSQEYYYPTGDTLNPEDGINYYYGVLETYYNLDMSGVVDWMHSLGYEGEYWVRSDGVKMFGDYVMVAADYDWMPKGSILETSLGLAMVCDTGEGGWFWTDIATCW